jgi:hypothetical protein
MIVPITNFSAIVTGAMDAAKPVATEMLQAAVTRDAVVETTRTTAAWVMQHLWTWLAVAVDSLSANAAAAARIAEGSAVEASGSWFQTGARLLHGVYAWLVTAAVDSLPANAAAAARIAVGSAVETSGPWLQTGARLLHGVYARLVTAAVKKLPDTAAEKLLSDTAAWFLNGHRVAVYVTTALVLLVLVTCRVQGQSEALLRHRPERQEAASSWRLRNWMQQASHRTCRCICGLPSSQGLARSHKRIGVAFSSIYWHLRLFMSMHAGYMYQIF